MNSRAQTATDTPILLSIFAFQAFILLGLGFLDVNSDTQEINNVFFDFGNIITGIEVLGWGNTLLFAPLIIALTYILIKLIRG